MCVVSLCLCEFVCVLCVGVCVCVLLQTTC